MMAMRLAIAHRSIRYDASMGSAARVISWGRAKYEIHMLPRRSLGWIQWKQQVTSSTES